MIVGVPVESHPHERRVSLVPAAVPTLAKAGLEVLVERGAGQNAGFPDAAYEEQGARLARDRIQLFSSSDVLLQVRGLGVNSEAGHADLELLHSGQVVLGLLNPLGVPDAARALAGRGVTAFALELLPRISRAQSMDALTSMATVAGYKAVLLAAASLQKMCPMMMTAAGTITPARFFVVGAGVAGLRLGAPTRYLEEHIGRGDELDSILCQTGSLLLVGGVGATGQWVRRACRSRTLPYRHVGACRNYTGSPGNFEIVVRKGRS